MDSLGLKELGIDLFTFKHNHIKHILFVKSYTKETSYMAFFETMDVLYSDVISKNNTSQIIKDWHLGNIRHNQVKRKT